MSSARGLEPGKALLLRLMDFFDEESEDLVVFSILLGKRYGRREMRDGKNLAQICRYAEGFPLNYNIERTKSKCQENT